MLITCNCLCLLPSFFSTFSCLINVLFISLDVAAQDIVKYVLYNRVIHNSNDSILNQLFSFSMAKELSIKINISGQIWESGAEFDACLSSNYNFFHPSPPYSAQVLKTRYITNNKLCHIVLISNLVKWNLFSFHSIR